MTFKSSIAVSSLNSVSWMPAAKYACAASALKSSKGHGVRQQAASATTGAMSR